MAARTARFFRQPPPPGPPVVSSAHLSQSLTGCIVIKQTGKAPGTRHLPTNPAPKPPTNFWAEMSREAPAPGGSGSAVLRELVPVSLRAGRWAGRCRVCSAGFGRAEDRCSGGFLRPEASGSYCSPDTNPSASTAQLWRRFLFSQSEASSRRPGTLFCVLPCKQQAEQISSSARVGILQLRHF